MPLIKSGSREAVSKNISEMIRAGHPRNQAIAAALSTARKYGKKYKDGGPAKENEWENVERSPEGRPRINVTPQEPQPESWEPPPWENEVFQGTAPPPTYQAQQPDPYKALNVQRSVEQPQDRFAVQEGPQRPEMSAAPEPTARERMARSLMDTMQGGYYKQQFVKGLLGTTGIGQQEMGLADVTPLGIPMAIEEAKRKGSPEEMALAVTPLGPAAKLKPSAALKGLGKFSEIPPEELASFKQIGPQAGTNPGGFYMSPSGEEFYIKIPKGGANHAREEVLTAKLYEAVGVPVAQPKLTTLKGSPAVATPIIEGDPLFISSAKNIKGIEEHFPADVWLNNPDVIGLERDNIIVNRQGMATRIDTGAGLRHRAQGKLKDHFGPDIEQLMEAMRDPARNKSAASVFGSVEIGPTNETAKRIAALPDSTIRDLVNTYGPESAKEKKALADTIIARRDNIAKAYGIDKTTPTSGGPSGGIPEAQPVKLMNLNKTTDPSTLAESLKGYHPDTIHSKHPGTLTPKMQDKIEYLVNSAPTNDLAAYMGKHLSSEQHNNVLAWAAPDKKQEVLAAIQGLKTGKEAAAVDELLATKNPNKLASLIVEKNRENAGLIAQDMFTLAEKAEPELADKVYQHLPSYLQDDVNGALTDYISKKGYDPWMGEKAPAGGKKRLTPEEEYEQKMESQAAHEAMIASGDIYEPSTAVDVGLSHLFDSYGNFIGELLTPQEAFRKVDWSTYRPLSKSAAKKPPVLPMVTQKRIEELKNEGWNTKLALYHSTKHGQPDVPYPPEFFDPKTFKAKAEHLFPERAWFFADRPEVAGSYHGIEGTGEYVARAPKALELDWRVIAGKPRYSNYTMNKIIEAGHQQNADLIIIHNMSDVGSAELQTQYAFLTNKGVRASRAKFDHDYMHLARPFLGLAGGGLFAYGALSGQKKEDSGMSNGGIPKKAGGGGVDSWMMHQASRNLHYEGMIKSGIPGRTDKIPMSVKSGSYIIPADIPSALGQGNSVAGGNILSKMFNSGPYGMATPRIHSGRGYPRGMSLRPQPMPKGTFAEGGDIESGEEEHSPTPIIAAGGEYVIPPEVVKALGNGDIGKGHRLLDAFVLHTRREHIRTLKKLKPPKK